MRTGAERKCEEGEGAAEGARKRDGGGLRRNEKGAEGGGGKRYRKTRFETKETAEEQEEMGADEERETATNFKLRRSVKRRVAKDKETVKKGGGRGTWGIGVQWGATGDGKWSLRCARRCFAGDQSAGRNHPATRAMRRVTSSLSRLRDDHSHCPAVPRPTATLSFVLVYHAPARMPSLF